MNQLHDIEARRIVLQSELDAGKTPISRNILGQFATPTILAHTLMRHAISLLGENEPIRMLEPAVGTGAFFSALVQTLAPERDAEAKGFEIDPHYGIPASTLWHGTRLNIEIGDFTKMTPPPENKLFNLVVANPPYVRHHHLEQGNKQRLHSASREAAGMNLSMLSGLYCHFLALAHPWMAPGALACWLIPSEFMDVNYGREVKRYLTEQVILLRIHRFDPENAQFDDALVSSAVVWFKNSQPLAEHRVSFTFGGTHDAPKTEREIDITTLKESAKWTQYPRGAQSGNQSDDPKLSDLFDIRRGIATGNNELFIVSPERVAELGLPLSQLTPVIPSPRYLDTDFVDADSAGEPLVERKRYLVDCRLSESQVPELFPTLWAYFESNREEATKGYICRNRSPWFQQENRPPAPLLCTYMGRGDGKGGKPFRFILNRSRGIVTNSYLNLYPKPHLAARLAKEPELLERIWRALNDLDSACMTDEGRVYGGGLHKMEPKELAQVSIKQLADLLAPIVRQTRLAI